MSIRRRISRALREPTCRALFARIRRQWIALPLLLLVGCLAPTAARADWAINGGTLSYELLDSSTTTSPFSGGNATTLNIVISGPSASWVVGTSGSPVSLSHAARQAAVANRHIQLLDGGEVIFYSNHVATPGAVPAVTALLVPSSNIQQVIDGRIRVYDSSGTDQHTDGFTYTNSSTPILLQIDDDADVYVESANDSTAVRASGGFNLSTLRGSLAASSTGNEAYGLATTFGPVMVANNTMEAAITATAGGNGAYGIYAFDSDGTVSGATIGTTLDITGSITATAADQAYGIYAGGGMNVRVVDTATISAIASSGTQAYALFSGSSGSSQLEIVAGATVVGGIRLLGAADSLVLSGAAADSTTLNAIMGLETISLTGGEWMLDGVISGASTLSSSGAVVVHLNAANTFSGAVNLGGGTIILGDDAALSTSSVTVSANSTLRSDADDRYLANNFSIAGATTLTVDGTNDLELAGDLSGAGGLTKSGSGTLVLGGNNSYGGATTVSGGRLVVDGQITSDVATAPATTLGGSGTIVGNVNNGGTVAPGNSVGTLTINGNYTHSSGANLEIEINDGGTTPGVNVDWLDVSGSATIQGGTVDVVAEPGSYTPFTQYTFLTAGSISGTFDSVTDNLAFLDAVLGYTGTSVNFILLPNNLDFAAAGRGGGRRPSCGQFGFTKCSTRTRWSTPASPRSAAAASRSAGSTWDATGCRRVWAPVGT